MTLLQSFGVSVDQFTWQSFADRKFLWLIHPVQNVAELMGNATGNAVFDFCMVPLQDFHSW